MECSVKARPVHVRRHRTARARAQVQRGFRSRFAGRTYRAVLGRVAKPQASECHVGLAGDRFDDRLQDRAQRTLLGNRQDDGRKWLQVHKSMIA